MEKKIKITIDETNLVNEGYTKSGQDRYKKTIKDYSQIVFEKAITFGEIDKSPSLTREVTHEHVKGAAYSIAKSYGRPKKPKWIPYAQVGQYLCAGLVGYYSSQLDNEKGILGFIISFSIGGLLLFIEKMKKV